MSDAIPTIDDLAKQYADDEYENLGDVVELARCVSINLDNIKPLAEAHPLVGIAWAQAKGLCHAIEKFYEYKSEASR